jgi:hypothetical protein
MHLKVPGGRYIVIFFRSGVLSVWDVASETCGCAAWIQTYLDHYTHTCEVLQDEQMVLIGLATGAHDTCVYHAYLSHATNDPIATMRIMANSRFLKSVSHHCMRKSQLLKFLKYRLIFQLPGYFWR